MSISLCTVGQLAHMVNNCISEALEVPHGDKREYVTEMRKIMGELMCVFEELHLAIKEAGGALDDLSAECDEEEEEAEEEEDAPEAAAAEHHSDAEDSSDSDSDS